MIKEGDGRSPGVRQFTGLGPALRRAWLGYHHRLDEAMGDAGFTDRRFPDPQVLRLCSAFDGVTISCIGRELDITRQGAGKIVSRLVDRGYAAVADSVTSGREKSVTVTTLGRDYLVAHRTAARQIEQDLRQQLGDEAVDKLFATLDVLGDRGGGRLRTYLRRSATPGDDAGAVEDAGQSDLPGNDT